jgi:hypothetical protein
MPLKYSVRVGMLGQDIIAPELSLESKYEDLVSWYRQNGYIRAYYTDKSRQIRHLPLYGRNLSKTMIKDLYDFSEGLTICK